MVFNNIGISRENFSEKSIWNLGVLKMAKRGRPKKKKTDTRSLAQDKEDRKKLVLETLKKHRELPAERQLSQDEQFLYLIQEGFTRKEAAKHSGFAERYGFEKYHSLTRDNQKYYAHLDRISQKMPGLYKMDARFNLADVSQIDRSVIERLKSDPDLAIRHPAILRQLKIAGGVLSDEQQSLPPTINVESIQVLLQQVGKKLVTDDE
jgi:hypothetical protein